MSNVHHLHRIVVAGRDTCNGSCQTSAGCDCCGQWPAPMPTNYGDDMKQPTVIKCRPLSLMARLALWLRRWL